MAKDYLLIELFKLIFWMTIGGFTGYFFGKFNSKRKKKP
jgi:hypothetical protein